MSAMKVIGRGHFTTAYQKDRNTVILKSRDKVKECMSMGWFPDTHLFPSVTCIKGQDQWGYSLYEMKYIDKVKAPKQQLTEEHYELYKKLKRLSWENCTNASHLIDCIHDMDVRRSIKDHLINAVSALTNYGSDVCFEISPRNIGVSKTGKLILLDVFFFKNDLRWN